MNYKQEINKQFEFFKNQLMQDKGYKFVEQLTDVDIATINAKTIEYQESLIIDNK